MSAQGADLHMAQLMPLPLTVSCFSKIPIGFTFLVPAHPGSPRQRAVKRVCVCVCVCVCVLHYLENHDPAVYVCIYVCVRVCVCVCGLDVDECRGPEGACLSPDAECVNVRGSHRCQCRPGFTAGVQQHTCTGLTDSTST